MTAFSFAISLPASVSARSTFGRWRGSRRSAWRSSYFLPLRFTSRCNSIWGDDRSRLMCGDRKAHGQWGWRVLGPCGRPLARLAAPLGMGFRASRPCGGHRRPDSRAPVPQMTAGRTVPGTVRIGVPCAMAARSVSGPATIARQNAHTQSPHAARRRRSPLPQAATSPRRRLRPGQCGAVECRASARSCCLRHLAREGQARPAGPGFAAATSATSASVRTASGPSRSSWPPGAPR